LRAPWRMDVARLSSTPWCRCAHRRGYRCLAVDQTRSISGASDRIAGQARAPAILEARRIWRSCRACAMASASRSLPNDDDGSPPNCCRHSPRSAARESRSKSPRSQSDRRRAGIGHSCCPIHAHIHPKRQSATAARRPASSFRLLVLKALCRPCAPVTSAQIQPPGYYDLTWRGGRSSASQICAVDRADRYAILRNAKRPASPRPGPRPAPAFGFKQDRPGSGSV
jgi:hypothetical protein